MRHEVNLGDFSGKGFDLAEEVFDHEAAVRGRSYPHHVFEEKFFPVPFLNIGG
jgi:hypothetical protein